MKRESSGRMGEEHDEVQQEKHKQEGYEGMDGKEEQRNTAKDRGM